MAKPVFDACWVHGPPTRSRTQEQDFDAPREQLLSFTMRVFDLNQVRQRLNTPKGGNSTPLPARELLHGLSGRRAWHVCKCRTARRRRMRC